MSAVPTRLSIDINADLGESFGPYTMGDDMALLDVVSSANIACGFHGGDPLVMQRTVAAALERGVAIGAHVSYRDLAGFGRRYLDASPAELEADVLYQLAALDGVTRAMGGQVSYVKPHGALYNTAVHNIVHADAVVSAIHRYNPQLSVLGMPDSQLLGKAAELQLTTIVEAFADRNYYADGTLVSRREPHALLHDPDLVAARMVTLVTDGYLRAAGGQSLRIPAASICVHGDTPGSLAMARAIKESLVDANIAITPFSTASPAHR